MGLQSRNTLKNWFKRGLKPLEAQFADWIDSFWHKSDSIPLESITGLVDSLNALAGAIAAGTPIGTWRMCGPWNATTNTMVGLVGTGLAGAIAQGNTFEVQGNSTILLNSDGSAYLDGTTIRALVDNPGDDPTKWHNHP